MKFVLACMALLAAVAAAGATPIVEISADSSFGQSLLSHARSLDQNAEEYEHLWIANYSIKFQGCHSIKQWNANVDNDNDVRLVTKNLVRFRMCPTDTCSDSKAAGCTGGYGDYVVDMADFMAAWQETHMQNVEYECQMYLTDTCGGCEEGEGDDWNKDYCEYDCFNDAAMTQCIDRNPYEEEEQGQQNEEFNIEDYMECAELRVQNQNRRLDDGQVQYFVGPYCSIQGGSIYLGLFTDDSCSVIASDVSFIDLMGYEMPYNTTSIVDATCVSCQEHEDANRQGENDQADADAVSEACENLYVEAGKCESALPEGMVSVVNDNACNYMEGILITRQDGIIDVGSATRPSAVATSFIVVFAMAFCAMAFYVWYLRTRLGVKKNTLLS